MHNTSKRLFGEELIFSLLATLIGFSVQPTVARNYLRISLILCECLQNSRSAQKTAYFFSFFWILLSHSTCDGFVPESDDVMAIVNLRQSAFAYFIRSSCFRHNEFLKQFLGFLQAVPQEDKNTRHTIFFLFAFDRTNRFSCTSPQLNSRKKWLSLGERKLRIMSTKMSKIKNSEGTCEKIHDDFHRISHMV